MIVVASRFLLSILIGCIPVSAAAEEETVILLHGLGRTDRSMRSLEKRLSKAGFRVQNLRYPSTELSPSELTVFLDGELATCCNSAARIHFVTHSMGGVLVRAYLAEHRPPNLGRVVMLAPPNHGSEFVDALGDSKLFRSVFGPTATELGTDENSLPNRLPRPWFELGIIAGTKSVNPLGAFVVPGESDGAVSVESARLAGMEDFVAVPTSHTFIVRSKQVAEYVIRFLRTGRFQAEAQPAGWDPTPAGPPAAGCNA